MKSILGIILSVFCVSNAFAQANLTTNTINQGFTFSANPSASEAPLPRNWRLAKSNTVRTVNPYPVSPASKADTTTQFKGGSLMAASSPAGFYNFGVGDSVTATNRAIGFLADANNIKSCNLYFHVKNANATNIVSFDVDYIMRKFKNGSNIAGFQIQMYFSYDGINWTDAGSDFLAGTTADGNNNGFTVLTGESFSSSGVVTQTVLPNQQFYFAWSYSVTTGLNTDNAPAYGIDAIIIKPNIALPISLVKFEAEKLAEKVKLQWTTATEINNEKFIIEKSSNGKDFKYLSEIKGSGTSKELNNYNIIDEQPYAGTSYYRLTQIDFDGKTETFEPVVVNRSRGVLSMEYRDGGEERGAGSNGLGARGWEQGVQIWMIYAPEDVLATVSVSDMNGRIIFTEKIQLKEGYQQYNLPSSELNNELHIVSLIAGNDVVRKKVMSSKL